MSVKLYNYDKLLKNRLNNIPSKIIFYILHLHNHCLSSNHFPICRLLNYAYAHVIVLVPTFQNWVDDLSISNGYDFLAINVKYRKSPVVAKFST